MNDEPPTAITQKVARAVETAELQRNRRWHERFFNDVVQPLIVPIIIGIVTVITGVIGAALLMWLDLNTLKFEVSQLRETVVRNEMKSTKNEQLQDAIDQLTAELRRQQTGANRR